MCVCKCKSVYDSHYACTCKFVCACKFMTLCLCESLAMRVLHIYDSVFACVYVCMCVCICDCVCVCVCVLYPGEVSLYPLSLPVIYGLAFKPSMILIAS